MSQTAQELERYRTLIQTLAQGQTLTMSDAQVTQTLMPEQLRESFELGVFLDQLPKLVVSRGEGQLQLTRTLGQGGMGVVYLARQRALDREVAVKTLREDRRDVQSKRGLLREAWITGRLEHPHIIPVHALGLDEQGQPLLVMKRVEGVSWDAAIVEPNRLPGTLRELEPLEAHLRVLSQVCLAVHFAHSRGILHRDLKPENVMLGEFGEVYLMDWGVAVSLRPEDRGRLPLAAEVDHIAGTPVYMAPEMAAADGQQLGPWTDVYLLGAILHELLTGSPRHQGQTMEQVLFAAYLSKPATYDARLPAELVELAQRATEAKPQARPQSAQAMRQALERYLVHRQSYALQQEAARLLDAADEDALASGSAPGSALGSAARTASGEVTSGGPALKASRSEREALASFALRQALRVWPDNLSARAQLLALTQARAERELACDQPQVAAALMDELGELGQQDAAMSALRERVASASLAQRQRLAQLQEVAAGLDLGVERARRSRLAVVLALMWGVGNLIAGALELRGALRMDARANVMLGVMFFVGLLAILSTQRRLWSSNSANRKVIQCLIFVTALDVSLRLSALYHGWSVGVIPFE